MPTTVLVADDKEVVLSSIRLLLDTEPGIRIVGEAGSFQQTSQSALDLKPQVVVMDLHMPDESSATEPLRFRFQIMKSTLLLVTALFVNAVQAQQLPESPSHKYFKEVVAAPESFVNDSVLRLSNQEGVFSGLACFPENPVWNMVHHKMESVEHTDFFLVWTPFYLEHTWTDSFKDWAMTTVGQLLHVMLNVPDQESKGLVNRGFVVISEYNNGFQIESHSAIILAGKDGVYTTSGLTAGRIGERGHFAAEEISSGATLSQSRSATVTAVRTILTLNYATMRFKFTAEGMTNGEWHTLFDDADYGKCEFIHKPK